MEIRKGTDEFGWLVYRIWHNGEIIAEAYTERHAKVIAEALEVHEREYARLDNPYVLLK